MHHEAFLQNILSRMFHPSPAARQCRRTAHSTMALKRMSSVIFLVPIAPPFSSAGNENGAGHSA